MIEKHQGTISMRNSFDNAYSSLKNIGSIILATKNGTLFTAISAMTQDNRRVFRFFQNETEYARCYECCWGHYYNCNRTRIGMYCKALDNQIK